MSSKNQRLFFVCFIVVSYVICQEINCHPESRMLERQKSVKEVKEVIEPEIKRARFSTIVEETISTNPDDFLDADRVLEYIYFGSGTESETNSDSDSDIDFL